MDQDNDQLLTKLSVRLVNIKSNETIGSAVLYSHPSLNGKVYIITAAHSLYEDKDIFEKPFDEIELHFFSTNTGYGSLVHKIDFNLVSTNIDQDIAVLVLDIDEVENITGILPVVNVVSDRTTHTDFISKGFPSATNGKEVVCINPKWVQEVPNLGKFQLNINQDFSDAFTVNYRIDGFSGAGIFLYDRQEIFLYGIFTRFLEAGKIIYCEPLTKLNNLLSTNYLPPLCYTFFGSHGINPHFFRENCETSIVQLGPRFNAELNFQLPIAFCFNAISRDRHFKHRLTKIVDKQLTTSVYTNGGKEISKIEERYTDLNAKIKDWYFTNSWNLADDVNLDDILLESQKFDQDADLKIRELYNKRREESEKGDNDNKNGNPRELYSSDISSLYEMSRNFSTFRDDIEDSLLTLSNNPVLILKGAAGSGKSHLLGDVLQKRNTEGLPTILLLGQLFVEGRSIWENILYQLDLKCTKLEFLTALNSIGKQIGTRVLIMVDAINEGAGKKIWRDALEGFIHDFSKYPAIGLVLSVRSTYWKSIVKEEIRDRQSITKIEHYGFRGQEYEAVKLFCEFYELTQPNFPLLNPEYGNPLFLHLICKGIKASPNKAFPHGFQGITKIFDYYFTAVKEKLIQKRDLYDYEPKLITNALNCFANACFERDRRSLPLSDAAKLLSVQYQQYPHLLADLIEESVLIRSYPFRYDYDDNSEEEEVVYFAYERFGDFYIAGELIKDIPDSKEAFRMFEKNQRLGMLIKDRFYYNTGILEALAVLLPERFNIDIFEVFKWISTEDDPITWDHSISHWYLNSLKWRKIDSIDDKKFIEWATTTNEFRISEEEYFNFLYEICAVEDHPFNSDRITNILLQDTMGLRDSFLQRFILYYSGKDDSGAAMPITRLIDWAWRSEISRQVSHETARLVAQALSWLLASTDTALRDQATKAMVNLLKDQIPALIQVFLKFISIDDTYIKERLCAVAYGCALRSKSQPELQLLAQTVYDNIFKDGNPPTHLLLRDYCRHVIEFALSKGVLLDISNGNFRPPYNATLPDKYPTKDELKIFQEGDDLEGEKGMAARANGKVIFSVLSWDFGRYTIESAIRDFEAIPLSYERETETFRKNLPRGGKTLFKTLSDHYSVFATPKEKRKRLRLSEEDRDRFWNAVDEVWELVQHKLLDKLDHNQQEFYVHKVLPYWDLLVKHKHDSDLELNKESIKAWIAKRVFDLGYDGQIHGTYDNRRDNYRRSEHPKIERIGKKYQWIAFYEILGILADNYKISDRYSTDKKSVMYEGPWDLTYRDLDPSFISLGRKKKYDDDEFGIVEDTRQWYLPPPYPHWRHLSDDWSTTTADLPNYAECLTRTDSYGKKWMYLFSSYSWKAPKPVGSSSYVYDRKEIWFMFQSFFVPKAKLNRTTAWLRDQEFHGRWLPEAYEVSNLFARESYWAPLSKKYEKERGTWRILEDSNLKVMISAQEGVGHLDGDDSGTHFHYKIPCKKLFEALDLEYANQDGELQNPAGEIIFSNVSPSGCMIRQDALTKFLDENDLEIVWTLLGEKNAFYDREFAKDIRKSYSAVFTLVNEQVQLSGEIKVTDW
jgi:hypothetical protein